MQLQDKPNLCKFKTDECQTTSLLGPPPPSANTILLSLEWIQQLYALRKRVIQGP